MAFTLYGLFVNLSKLNKAAAIVMMACLNALCMPAAHVKNAGKKASKFVGNTPRKCVDKMMGPEWVRTRTHATSCITVPYRNVPYCTVHDKFF